MLIRFRQSRSIKNKSTYASLSKGGPIKSANLKGYCSKGFTLIELVVAMVLLGILSVGVSSFLQFGSQIYADATARDQILSSARFAIERLNRELRASLPNSSRITNDCLEFMPIKASAIYVDIPVSPDSASDKITIVPASTSVSSADIISLNAIVYPVAADDVYLKSNKKFYPIDIVTYSSDPTNVPHTLTLEDSVLFAEESATNRIYFIDDSVMYCIEGSGDNKNLIRYDVTDHSNAGEPLGLTNRAVMAEFLMNSSGFSTNGANLQRNAIVSVRLHFMRLFEEIVFDNEIQVPNVP
ncbi:PilW family protein [Colwellia hornerae]|uniref:Type II secretion system protein n=1 Tax=Colwellia hornerae TaxID=89402 RepID=A0A5C6Q6Z6_9GAMM|nr:type II secretion system protein [Colwellia hornerae]TWX49190.1 type II secretion system protein [Colwellia hornerae]TWX55617.1 type II secretion system protein [Colwellia hornerae]TWX64633.1 type II secretion system protein [Colwellia hornerae]